MKNPMIYFIFTVTILFISSLLFSVRTSDLLGDNTGYQSKTFELPFEMIRPDKVYKMPKELKEISGISYAGKDHFLTINDENPKLYTYDLSKEKIISEIDFGKKGDYEAVTRNNNLAYVAESNGNLKVVDLDEKEKSNEYDPPLSSKNNVEGICYDSQKNQLLIACKGQLEEKNKKGKRGIYSFDLTKNSFDKTPFKIIDIKKERESLQPVNLYDGFINNINIKSRLGKFAPSGIAIDPITRDIYIVAHRGKLLVVLDKNKNMQGIYFLSNDLFGQPEGITFDEKGNLYISNEARSEKANIMKFSRK